jgi:hypothetical protein
MSYDVFAAVRLSSHKVRETVSTIVHALIVLAVSLCTLYMRVLSLKLSAILYANSVYHILAAHQVVCRCDSWAYHLILTKILLSRHTAASNNTNCIACA